MGDIVSMHALAKQDTPAVIDDRPDGRQLTLTWRQLDDQANQLANVLLERGAGPGTKIVWCGQNSIGVVLAVNAARRIGATAVPLNYRLSDEEAAYVTDHCDAALVYADAEQAALFARIRDQIPNVEHVLIYDGAPEAGQESVDAVIRAAPTAEPPAPEGEAATMIYTSGTTGKPKGAFRRGAGDPAQVLAMVQHIGFAPDDVHVTTGPLYHSGPGAFMQLAQLLGNLVIIQRKFDPEDWLRLVDTYRVTTTFSAPTPVRMVCALPAEVKQRYDRSSMRRMIANAAPWSFALKQMYLADFPDDSLWEVYGSTELGIDTILDPADQLRKPGSCGKPAPGVEIRLYDDAGNVVEGSGPEQTGELYVRSGSTFADYYKQHDKYLEDQRDGFQTVGDIAYRDDEGYYYIADRKKDMIISGGMNIYPAEIEAALEVHPDIYEVAVFGTPSEEWGESVHAVVVLRPGATMTEEDVVAHARQHLAGYKIPRSVTWADELPKTGSGKLLKRELRAPFWADQERMV
ncbi:MAG TPA: AMP-binding protein [Acidimicrobiales bacterium]|jgi:fatty-acyl-CoA synthase/long-chain acyl-CoA synthetase|nr:AMP-binding protein [Acidimicrobiales bacterium]